MSMGDEADQVLAEKRQRETRREEELRLGRQRYETWMNAVRSNGREFAAEANALGLLPTAQPRGEQFWELFVPFEAAHGSFNRFRTRVDRDGRVSFAYMALGPWGPEPRPSMMVAAGEAEVRAAFVEKLAAVKEAAHTR